MPNSSLCLLLDTNVWLEKYLPWRAGHGTVLALLREADLQEIPIAFPAQSALDVYQRVRIENKRWARDSGRLDDHMAQAIKRLAWDCVNDMRDLATAVPADSSDLYLACKHSGNERPKAVGTLSRGSCHPRKYARTPKSWHCPWCAHSSREHRLSARLAQDDLRIVGKRLTGFWIQAL